MKRAVLVAIALATLFHLHRARVDAQVPPDTLTFFRNHFVTGDFVTRGVVLRGAGVSGFATGNITIPAAGQGGVPAGAEVVAAYLYWQVVTTTGAGTGSAGVTFRPQNVTTAYRLEADNPATQAVDFEPYGKTLAFAGTAPCFNPGGGTGTGGAAVTWTYRVDALRFFAVDQNPGPNQGKLLVNGTHQIRIPDSGPNGNNSPMGLGASLLIIYRVPSMPLSAIVIYDDGVSLNNAQRTLVQTIGGFYQASATPNAKLAYVGGSGQNNKNDFVILPGGTRVNNVFNTQWETLNFPAAQRPVTVAPGASQVQTTVSNDVSGGGGRDCVTMAAMVFKTEVQDTDGDGLLDVWETFSTQTGAAALRDPKGQELPRLGAMGANPNRKDLFIEIGYMGVDAQVDSPPDDEGDWCAWTQCPDTDNLPDSVSYGGVLRPPHHHLLGHEALKLVGDAFADAPVDNGQGIAVHFDVGPNYPLCVQGEPCADDYIIGRRAGESPSLARGGTRVGESIDEMVTVCQPAAGAPEWECQFSGHPGTVGWKSGFRFLRDQVLSVSVNGGAPTSPPPPGFDEELCGTTVNGSSYSCERRFDSNRMHSFRYALFAHALGLPSSEFPCLNGGTPVAASPVTDRCPAGTTPNPAFHTPRTNTGIGDFLGADILGTLGAFVDYDNITPTGTPFQQAATLMHESGHTLGRRHAGDALEPNCKPQYFSVMNYTYQLRGLISTLPGPGLGLPVLDFSRDSQDGADLDETQLSDGNSGVNVTTAPYSLASFVPITVPLPDPNRPWLKAARRHCDGSVITDNAQYFRAESAPGAVDWRQDGAGNAGWVDINFDGVQQAGPTSLEGSNDWNQLALNQIGSRRSVGALFVDPAGRFLVGPLSADAGKGDLGKGDLGKGDLGKGDLGKGDLGKGDLGKGDLGKGDLGKGDLGKGDLGTGDLFGDEGEIDEALATDLTRVPPYAVAACQVGGPSCIPPGEGAPENYVRVSWTAPTVGGIIRYTVYRALEGTGGQPGPFESAGTVTVTAGQSNREFEFIDPNSHRLVNGRTYHYVVTATYSVRNPTTGLPEDLESTASTPDALVTITNAPPTIVHTIPPQMIVMGGSTAELPFTVGDLETLATGAATANNLTVSAAVTGETTEGLAAAIGVALGPGGPTSTATARTLVLSHTGTLAGTVTITLSVVDTQCSHNNPPVPCTPGGATATSFTLTVVPPFELQGTLNVPPTEPEGSFNPGSIVAFEWQYVAALSENDAPVDTSELAFDVTVSGPTGEPVVQETYSSGDNSAFSYDSETRTWRFDLETTLGSEQDFPEGEYTVTITSTDPEYGPSPAFTFTLEFEVD